MKLIFTFLFISFLIENQKAYSQNALDKEYSKPQSFLCEASRIGNLITKPLLKDSLIHYELTYSGNWDKNVPNADGVELVKEAFNTFVTRNHNLRDTSLHLSFVFNASKQICSYQFAILYLKKKKRDILNIDGNGKYLGLFEKNTTQKEIIKYQKLIDMALKYYE